MRATDAYARLQALGQPVLTTRDAAVVWGTSLPTAVRTLTRLVKSGLVVKIRQGIWQLGRVPADATFVLPVLTNPYPSYVSGWSALSHHGMIEQIPRGIFAVSLDRPKTVDTELGQFEIHHMHHDLFGGFEGETGIQAGIARPEKALFDTVYLFSVRLGKVTLPELELPEGFDTEELQRWVEAIPTNRLQTMTSFSLARLVEGAAPQPA
jgi:predicted transcriptional regulator of viral defense system